jgi:hypothetical protein
MRPVAPTSERRTIRIQYSSDRNGAFPEETKKRSGVNRSSILWIYSTIYPAEKQIERKRADGKAAPDAHSMIVSLPLDSGK